MGTGQLPATLPRERSTCEHMTWYAGWYRQLIQTISLMCFQGKLRSLSGENLIELLS